MVIVPHELMGLERMSVYEGVRLQRFHCVNVLLKSDQNLLDVWKNYTHLLYECRVRSMYTDH